MFLQFNDVIILVEFTPSLQDVLQVLYNHYSNTHFSQASVLLVVTHYIFGLIDWLALVIGSPPPTPPLTFFFQHFIVIWTSLLDV